MTESLLARLRARVLELIRVQTAVDQCPKSAAEQEAQSDAMLVDAQRIHRTLSAHADEIEKRLADVVVVRSRRP